MSIYELNEFIYEELTKLYDNIHKIVDDQCMGILSYDRFDDFVDLMYDSYINKYKNNYSFKG